MLAAALAARPRCRRSAGRRLALGLGAFPRCLGCWVILDEPELHFGNDVLVPDLAGWRRSVADVPAEAYMTLAPDWICEVLSESTEALDRNKKLRIYARERVAHAWLVDPLRRTLEVLALESGTWTPLITHGGGGGFERSRSMQSSSSSPRSGFDGLFNRTQSSRPHPPRAAGRSCRGRSPRWCPRPFTYHSFVRFVPNSDTYQSRFASR